MRSEEVLPRLSYQRFPLAVRIIASILVVTFLAQDIVWAHPDSLVRSQSQNNKLNIEPLSKHQEQFFKVYIRAVDELVQNELTKIPGKDPKEISLDDIKRAIRAIRDRNDNWFEKNKLKCIEKDDEVLISFPPGYIIRYFQSAANEHTYANDRIITTVPVNESAQLYKQILETKALPAPDQTENGNQPPQSNGTVPGHRLTGQICISFIRAAWKTVRSFLYDDQGAVIFNICVIPIPAGIARKIGKYIPKWCRRGFEFILSYGSIERKIKNKILILENIALHIKLQGRETISQREIMSGIKAASLLAQYPGKVAYTPNLMYQACFILNEIFMVWEDSIGEKSEKGDFLEKLAYALSSICKERGDVIIANQMTAIRDIIAAPQLPHATRKTAADALVKYFEYLGDTFFPRGEEELRPRILSAIAFEEERLREAMAKLQKEAKADEAVLEPIKYAIAGLEYLHRILTPKVSKYGTPLLNKSSNDDGGVINNHMAIEQEEQLTGETLHLTESDLEALISELEKAVAAGDFISIVDVREKKLPKIHAAAQLHKALADLDLIYTAATDDELKEIVKTYKLNYAEKRVFYLLIEPSLDEMDRTIKSLTEGSTGKVHLVMGLHGQNPYGNDIFHNTLDEQVKNFIEPFAGFLEAHPYFKTSIHFSGPQLRQLSQSYPRLLARYRKLCENGQIEIIGGTASEAFESLLDYDLMIKDLVDLADLVEKLFGKRPKAAWAAERLKLALNFENGDKITSIKVEEGLRRLSKAGYEYLMAADDNVLEWTGMKYRTSIREEDPVYTLDSLVKDNIDFKIVKGSNVLRQIIPFAEIGKVSSYMKGKIANAKAKLAKGLDELKQMKKEAEKLADKPRELREIASRFEAKARELKTCSLLTVVYADDFDKFGGWQGTNELCYGEKQWLNKFAELCDPANSKAVISTEFISAHLDKITPVVLEGLAGGSYREFSDWSLTPPERGELMGLEREIDLLGKERLFGKASGAIDILNKLAAGKATPQEVAGFIVVLKAREEMLDASGEAGAIEEIIAKNPEEITAEEQNNLYNSLMNIVDVSGWEALGAGEKTEGKALISKQSRYMTLLEGGYAGQIKKYPYLDFVIGFANWAGEKIKNENAGNDNRKKRLIDMARRTLVSGLGSCHLFHGWFGGLRFMHFRKQTIDALGTTLRLMKAAGIDIKPGEMVLGPYQIKSRILMDGNQWLAMHTSGNIVSWQANGIDPVASSFLEREEWAHHPRNDTSDGKGDGKSEIKRAAGWMLNPEERKGALGGGTAGRKGRPMQPDRVNIGTIAQAHFYFEKNALTLDKVNSALNPFSVKLSPAELELVKTSNLVDIPKGMLIVSIAYDPQSHGYHLNVGNPEDIIKSIPDKGHYLGELLDCPMSGLCVPVLNKGKGDISAGNFVLGRFDPVKAETAEDGVKIEENGYTVTSKYPNPGNIELKRKVTLGEGGLISQHYTITNSSNSPVDLNFALASFLSLTCIDQFDVTVNDNKIGKPDSGALKKQEGVKKFILEEGGEEWKVNARITFTVIPDNGSDAQFNLEIEPMFGVCNGDKGFEKTYNGTAYLLTLPHRALSANQSLSFTVTVKSEALDPDFRKTQLKSGSAGVQEALTEDRKFLQDNTTLNPNEIESVILHLHHPRPVSEKPEVIEDIRNKNTVSEMGKQYEVRDVKLDTDENIMEVTAKNKKNKKEETFPLELKKAYECRPEETVKYVAGQTAKDIVGRILEQFPLRKNVWVYKDLKGDLLGFPSCKNELVAIYEDLYADARLRHMAVFHEVGEYLMKKARDDGKETVLSLELKGNKLIVNIDGYEAIITLKYAIDSLRKEFSAEKTREDKVWLDWGEEKLNQDKNRHYLLRILQRELFKELDEELTGKIRDILAVKLPAAPDTGADGPEWQRPDTFEEEFNRTSSVKLYLQENDLKWRLRNDSLQSSDNLFYSRLWGIGSPAPVLSKDDEIFSIAEHISRVNIVMAKLIKNWNETASLNGDQPLSYEKARFFNIARYLGKIPFSSYGWAKGFGENFGQSYNNEIQNGYEIAAEVFKREEEKEKKEKKMEGREKESIPPEVRMYFEKMRMEVLIDEPEAKVAEQADKIVRLVTGMVHARYSRCIIDKEDNAEQKDKKREPDQTEIRLCADFKELFHIDLPQKIDRRDIENLITSISGSFIKNKILYNKDFSLDTRSLAAIKKLNGEIDERILKKFTGPSALATLKAAMNILSVIRQKYKGGGSAALLEALQKTELVFLEMALAERNRRAEEKWKKEQNDPGKEIAEPPVPKKVKNWKEYLSADSKSADVLTYDISVLDIYMTVEATLRNKGIYTLNDLRQLTAKTLGSVEGVGPQILEEIKQKLFKFKLLLAKDENDPESNIPIPTREELRDQKILHDAVKREILKKLPNPALPCRSVLIAFYIEGKTAREIFKAGEAKKDRAQQRLDVGVTALKTWLHIFGAEEGGIDIALSQLREEACEARRIAKSQLPSAEPPAAATEANNGLHQQEVLNAALQEVLNDMLREAVQGTNAVLPFTAQRQDLLRRFYIEGQDIEDIANAATVGSDIIYRRLDSVRKIINRNFATYSGASKKAVSNGLKLIRRRARKLYSRIESAQPVDLISSYADLRQQEGLTSILKKVIQGKYGIPELTGPLQATARACYFKGKTKRDVAEAEGEPLQANKVYLRLVKFRTILKKSLAPLGVEAGEIDRVLEQMRKESHTLKLSMENMPLEGLSGMLRTIMDGKYSNIIPELTTSLLETAQMYYLEGKTKEEIKESSNSDKAAIKSELVNVRKILKRELAGFDVEGEEVEQVLAQMRKEAKISAQGEEPSPSGMAVLSKGLFPHRLEGNVNDCIVKALAKTIGELERRARKKGKGSLTPHEKIQFDSFRRWLRDSKGEYNGDVPEHNQLPLRSIAYPIEVRRGQLRRILWVVELPVDKKLGEIGGEPFTAHLGFTTEISADEGIVWVATGSRDRIEIDLDVMHEVEEYKIAWEKADKLGKDMRSIAEWRDEAKQKAQEFFNAAHIKAWKSVAAACKVEYDNVNESRVIPFHRPGSDEDNARLGNIKKLKSMWEIADRLYKEARRSKPALVPLGAGIAVVSSEEMPLQQYGEVRRANQREFRYIKEVLGLTTATYAIALGANKNTMQNYLRLTSPKAIPEKYMQKARELLIRAGKSKPVVSIKTAPENTDNSHLSPSIEKPNSMAEGLRSCMEQNHLTDSELAKRSKVSLITIDSILRGNDDIRRDTITALAWALNVKEAKIDPNYNDNRDLVTDVDTMPQMVTEAIIEVKARITELMEKDSLTLHEVAKMTGVSAPTIKAIVSGSASYHLDTILRLAKALRLKRAFSIMRTLFPEDAASIRGKTKDETDKSQMSPAVIADPWNRSEDGALGDLDNDVPLIVAEALDSLSFRQDVIKSIPAGESIINDTHLFIALRGEISKGRKRFLQLGGADGGLFLFVLKQYAKHKGYDIACYGYESKADSIETMELLGIKAIDQFSLEMTAKLDDRSKYDCVFTQNLTLSDLKLKKSERRKFINFINKLKDLINKNGVIIIDSDIKGWEYNRDAVVELCNELGFSVKRKRSARPERSDPANMLLILKRLPSSPAYRGPRGDSGGYINGLLKDAVNAYDEGKALEAESKIEDARKKYEEAGDRASEAWDWIISFNSISNEEERADIIHRLSLLEKGKAESYIGPEEERQAREMSIKAAAALKRLDMEFSVTAKEIASWMHRFKGLIGEIERIGPDDLNFKNKCEEKVVPILEAEIRRRKENPGNTEGVEGLISECNAVFSEIYQHWIKLIDNGSAQREDAISHLGRILNIVSELTHEIIRSDPAASLNGVYNGCQMNALNYMDRLIFALEDYTDKVDETKSAGIRSLSEELFILKETLRNFPDSSMPDIEEQEGWWDMRFWFEFNIRYRFKDIRERINAAIGYGAKHIETEMRGVSKWLRWTGTEINERFWLLDVERANYYLRKAHDALIKERLPPGRWKREFVSQISDISKDAAEIAGHGDFTGYDRDPLAMDLKEDVERFRDTWRKRAQDESINLSGVLGYVDAAINALSEIGAISPESLAHIPLDQFMRRAKGILSARSGAQAEALKVNGIVSEILQALTITNKIAGERAGAADVNENMFIDQADMYLRLGVDKLLAGDFFNAKESMYCVEHVLNDIMDFCIGRENNGSAEEIEAYKDLLSRVRNIRSDTIKLWLSGHPLAKDVLNDILSMQLRECSYRYAGMENPTLDSISNRKIFRDSSFKKFKKRLNKAHRAMTECTYGGGYVKRSEWLSDAITELDHARAAINHPDFNAAETLGQLGIMVDFMQQLNKYVVDLEQGDPKAAQKLSAFLVETYVAGNPTSAAQPKNSIAPAQEKQPDYYGQLSLIDPHRAQEITAFGYGPAVSNILAGVVLRKLEKPEAMSSITRELGQTDTGTAMMLLNKLEINDLLLMAQPQEAVPANSFRYETFVIDVKTGEKVNVVIREEDEEHPGKLIMEKAGKPIGILYYSIHAYNDDIDTLCVGDITVDEMSRYARGEHRELKCCGLRLMQAACMVSQRLPNTKGAIDLVTDEEYIGQQRFYKSMEPYGLKGGIPVGDGYDLCWLLEARDAARFVQGIDDAITSRLRAEIGPSARGTEPPVQEMPHPDTKMAPDKVIRDAINLNGRKENHFATGERNNNDQFLYRISLLQEIKSIRDIANQFADPENTENLFTTNGKIEYELTYMLRHALAPSGRYLDSLMAKIMDSPSIDIAAWKSYLQELLSDYQCASDLIDRIITSLERNTSLPQEDLSTVVPGVSFRILSAAQQHRDHLNNSYVQGFLKTQEFIHQHSQMVQNFILEMNEISETVSEIASDVSSEQIRNNPQDAIQSVPLQENSGPVIPKTEGDITTSVAAIDDSTLHPKIKEAIESGWAASLDCEMDKEEMGLVFHAAERSDREVASALTKNFKFSSEAKRKEVTALLEERLRTGAVSRSDLQDAFPLIRDIIKRKDFRIVIIFSPDPVFKDLDMLAHASRKSSPKKSVYINLDTCVAARQADDMKRGFEALIRHETYHHSENYGEGSCFMDPDNAGHYYENKDNYNAVRDFYDALKKIKEARFVTLKDLFGDAIPYKQGLFLLCLNKLSEYGIADNGKMRFYKGHSWEPRLQKATLWKLADKTKSWNLPYSEGLLGLADTAGYAIVPIFDGLKTRWKNLSDDKMRSLGFEKVLDGNGKAIDIPCFAHGGRSLTLPGEYHIYARVSGDGMIILKTKEEVDSTPPEELVILKGCALQIKGVGSPYGGIGLDTEHLPLGEGGKEPEGAAYHGNLEYENDAKLLKAGARLSTVSLGCVEILNDRQFKGLLKPAIYQNVRLVISDTRRLEDFMEQMAICGMGGMSGPTNDYRVFIESAYRPDDFEGARKKHLAELSRNIGLNLRAMFKVGLVPYIGNKTDNNIDIFGRMTDTGDLRSIYSEETGKGKYAIADFIGNVCKIYQSAFNGSHSDARGTAFLMSDCLKILLEAFLGEKEGRRIDNMVKQELLAGRLYYGRNIFAAGGAEGFDKIADMIIDDAQKLTANSDGSAQETAPAIDYVKELRGKIDAAAENIIPVAEIQQNIAGKGLGTKPSQSVSQFNVVRDETPTTAFAPTQAKSTSSAAEIKPIPMSPDEKDILKNSFPGETQSRMAPETLTVDELKGFDAATQEAFLCEAPEALHDADTSIGFSRIQWDQRKLIKNNLKETIFEKEKKGKRVLTIYTIGLGMTNGPKESRQFIKFLGSTFREIGETVNLKNWQINFIGVDIKDCRHYADILRQAVQKTIPAECKFNIFIEQGDIYNINSLKRIVGHYPQADYIIHRNTHYPLEYSRILSLMLERLPISDCIGKVLLIYLPLRNVVETFGREGAIYITEEQAGPRYTDEAYSKHSVLMIPGARLLTANELVSTFSFPPKSPANRGTGIYLIEDANAMRTNGVKHFMENTLGITLSSSGIGISSSGILRTGIGIKSSTAEGNPKGAIPPVPALKIEPLPKAPGEEEDMKQFPGGEKSFYHKRKPEDQRSDSKRAGNAEIEFKSRLFNQNLQHKIEQGKVVDLGYLDNDIIASILGSFGERSFDIGQCSFQTGIAHTGNIAREFILNAVQSQDRTDTDRSILEDFAIFPKVRVKLHLLGDNEGSMLELEIKQKELKEEDWLRLKNNHRLYVERGLTVLDRTGEEYFKNGSGGNGLVTMDFLGSQSPVRLLYQKTSDEEYKLTTRLFYRVIMPSDQYREFINRALGTKSEPSQTTPAKAGVESSNGTTGGIEPVMPQTLPDVLPKEPYHSPTDTEIMKLSTGGVTAISGPEQLDALRIFINEADRRFRESIAAKPLPAGTQIFFSETMFDELDSINLKSLLGKDRAVKVASYDRIKEVATDKNAIKEESEGKTACVVTKTEFEKLCKERGLIQNRDRLKVTILVLDNLKGKNYLYLEGVLGLVKSMMEKDPAAVRIYMRFLFSDVLIDKAEVNDAELENFLKKNDFIDLALRVTLIFKPITKEDVEGNLDHYKAMMEAVLIRA